MVYCQDANGASVWVALKAAQSPYNIRDNVFNKDGGTAVGRVLVELDCIRVFAFIKVREKHCVVLLGV